MSSMTPPGPGDFLKALPQYVLPQHALSRLVHLVTRSEKPWIRDRLLAGFLDRFDVNLDEAERDDPDDYRSFNDFFTRSLKPGARPLADAPIVSPVDGRVSQQGEINETRLFQAKGRRFDLKTLLGDRDAAEPFRNGHFCTLYRAPHNYHRIHMPLEGRLTGLHHIPGRLFSVNPATTRVIPRLFARNERVVAHFDTHYGPMALVMVGAMLVGSIETIWTGEITPPTRLRSRELPLPPTSQRKLRQGDEVGRFNMGSTVIVLLPESAPGFRRELYHQAPVQLGAALSDSHDR